MLDGVMLLWFIQVGISVVFVAIDIRTTPEATVMKWGFVIVTAFSGLFGAVLYVLSCREPLPGTHEVYVAARWRQTVGSTMHCVAGDGVGILAAAVVTSLLGVPMWVEVIAEYSFGFLFGWTVFQALFMRSMFGAYRRALTRTFMSELLSMNAVMGGMTAVMVPWMTHDGAAMHPGGARFWFVMSIALCVGFLVALPVNHWLVARGLKHGMMTVRAGDGTVPEAAVVARAAARLSGFSLVPADDPAAASDQEAPPGHEQHGSDERPGAARLAMMTLLTFAVFGAGFVIAGAFGDLTLSH